MATSNDVQILDVGPDQYGDCILCRIGGKTILIDGAHPGDDSATDFENIFKQLKALVGSDPVKVDLLIVTHTHRDHIGCLPSLVKTKKLEAVDALVADPEMGWSMPESIDAVPAGRNNRIAMALREEAFVSDEPQEMSEFLDSAGGLFDQYVTMLNSLSDRGTNVVRYRRDNDAAVKAVVNKYKTSSGLVVLGPTYDHLELCRDVVADKGRDMLDALDAMDASTSEVEAYLTLLRSADASESSAAINDQSIVVSVGKSSKRVLLTGDMQFGNPEVDNLKTPHIDPLVQRIDDQGPYVMVKLAHHGSVNASSPELFQAVGNAQIFFISTGSKSNKHPYQETLDMITAHGTAIGKDVRWGRTDRNGRLFVTLGSPVAANKSRGSWNDHTKAQDFDFVFERATESGESGEGAEGGSGVLVHQSVASREGPVEVHVKIPHVQTKVTVSIQVDPRGSGSGGGASVSARSRPGKAELPKTVRGDARSLADVLVLTDADRLAQATNEQAARDAIEALEGRGARVISDFPSTANDAQRMDFARNAMTQYSSRGMLILGGYDVVPPVVTDALDDALRNQLGTTNDPDDFKVWCDDPYADVDDSAVPDIPISRLPDGHSAELLQSAIQAGRATGGRAYVLHNAFRPFAAEILPTAQRLLDVSHPLKSDTLDGSRLEAMRLYFMLHGDDGDATRFWGETPTNGALEAIRADQVGTLSPGTVVFAGCCWGAMVGDRSALQTPPGVMPRGRTPDQSIALRCLANGASAFVGCSGAHYSPTEAPYDYFGGPIHLDFWQLLPQSQSPAVALFEAKRRYLEGFPHGRQRPLEQAIERKILRQFTCLGIGW